MPKPFFLFAPGAGAPSASAWMQRWKRHLEEVGTVVAFDYDYMRAGRKRPDRLSELITAHRAALREFTCREAGGRAFEASPAVGNRRSLGAPEGVFLIGKSMGGRIGCHVSLEEKVAGLICLGYPLCGMGDPSKLRDQVLKSLGTPILFIQGTRDPLCPLDLLDKVRAEMSAPNFLEVVAGGDHSLGVRKRELIARGETQENVDQRILAAIRRFVDLFF